MHGVPPPKTWWDRNWKWFLPVTGLAGLALAGAAAIVFVVLTFGLVKTTDIYQQSLAAAQSDPDVIDALGSPINPGFLVSGNVKADDQSGTAKLMIPIRGPKGAAVIYVKASKDKGEWDFDDLEVQVQATHQTIDLLAQPSDSGQSDEPPQDQAPAPAPDAHQI